MSRKTKKSLPNSHPQEPPQVATAANGERRADQHKGEALVVHQRGRVEQGVEGIGQAVGAGIADDALALLPQRGGILPVRMRG